MVYYLKKIVAVVMMVLMGFGGYSLYNEFGGKDSPVPAVIISDIQNLQELATIQYRYNTYLKYEKERPKIPFTDWNVPGTRSRAVFKVAGCIKLGVNLQNAMVRQLGNQLVVTLPNADVLSHEFDLSKCQTEFEDTSIFNLPEANDYLAFIHSQKERIAQSELSDSIMLSAKERAKQMIKNYIHGVDNRLNVTFVG